MLIYRVASARYPVNDGYGAKLSGGRWNHQGTAVIYAAQSIALCALEVLANVDELPQDYVSIEIEIPEHLNWTVLEADDMPPDWENTPPSDRTRGMGTTWAASLSTAVLVVPSVVIPRERNFILNPAHPAFQDIRFGTPEPFDFDPRLK
ncbi:MAG: RES domain-containing protein [Acidobacteriota bacterium]